MTIFNTGYSGFEYEPTSLFGRIAPVIRNEFTQIFRTKKGVLVFVLCVLFVVVKALAMYYILSPDSEATAEAMAFVEDRFPTLSPFQALFYINHATDWGWVPLLMLTSLVSVRAIAGDRATNALEIYWTRGISPWSYFLGKWMGSALLLGAAFFAGPFLLWIYGLIAAPDASYFERTIEFMPQVLLALLLMCLIHSFLAVGFSAMSESPNVATFVWLLVIGGSKALGDILTAVSRHQQRAVDVVYEPPWYKAICPVEAMNRIQEDLAGLPPGPSDFEQMWVAWLFLGIYAGIVVFKLKGFLKTTEAVA